MLGTPGAGKMEAPFALWQLHLPECAGRNSCVPLSFEKWLPRPEQLALVYPGSGLPSAEKKNQQQQEKRKTDGQYHAVLKSRCGQCHMATSKGLKSTVTQQQGLNSASF